MDAIINQWESEIELLNLCFFMLSAAHLAQDSAMYSKYYNQFFIHDKNCDEIEIIYNTLKTK